MATYNKDAWLEEANVAITVQAGSDVEFDTLTETVDIDTGEKDFDTIANIAGGRIIKFTPEGETTVTLEAYPVEAGTASGTTGKGFFGLLNAEDTTQPLEIPTTTTRNKIRLAVLWTDSTTVTTACAQIPNGSNAIRFVGADGYITSAKASFTDNIQKWTITAKFPAFDKSGNACVQWESTDNTATLSALAGYTTATKFR